MRASSLRRPRLAIELLEARDVPAGNVLATLSPTGVLTLTGDDLGNGIERLTVATGSVTIDPDATTKVNGGAPGAPVTLAGGTVAITALLKGGPDELHINPSVDFLVPGVVLFDMGDGDNTLDLAQDLSTQELLRIGTLLVRGGDGFDTVSLRGGYRGTADDPGGPQSSYVNSIAFSYGDGGSDTTLGDGFLGRLPGQVNITAGDGRDEVHMAPAGVSNLVVAGGPGVVRVDGIGSGLGLSITGQDVEFDTAGSVFGGFPIGAYPVNIIGTASATVTLGDSAGFYAPVTVQALRRDGVATVDVVGPFVGLTPSPPIASLVVRSAGSASFIVHPGASFEINGRVGVTAGFGDALVEVDSGEMVVRGPLSVASLAGNARVVQTGPAAASHLDLETFNDFGVPGAPANFTLTAARTAELDLAGGRAELGGAVTVAGQAAGRLIQSGPDTVATVSGPLRVSSAGSEARLDLTGDSWTAKGTTAVTGLGRAVVNLTTATTDRFEQNVAVTGGLGLDLVTASPTARFLRNLSVGLGAGGGQLALDPGVTVGGALTVNGGTGVDVVSIRGVSVGGNTRIVTGGGKDTLTVDQGSTFTGTFYADLGGGDDTIAVAQSGGSPVTFSGKATILAGLGDDTLRLGQAGIAGAQAVFTTAGSLIDGGMGLNLFDDEAASFTGPVLIVHWTDPTP